MSTIIDLTHTLAQSTPVHEFDDPVSLEKIRDLAQHGYNDWRLSSGMHVGTHIDGPGHLTADPTLLSDLPVSRFIGTGIVLDARHKVLDAALLQDMPAAEHQIILILTGWDKKFGTGDYFNNHPIMQADLANGLAQHSITMVGIDFFSPDTYPFAVHKIFFKHNILLIENLTNLELLVGIQNFTVAALPLKTATDSALARVIAIVE